MHSFSRVRRGGHTSLKSRGPGLHTSREGTRGQDAARQAYLGPLHADVLQTLDDDHGQVGQCDLPGPDRKVGCRGAVEEPAVRLQTRTTRATVRPHPSLPHSQQAPSSSSLSPPPLQSARTARYESGGSGSMSVCRKSGPSKVCRRCSRDSYTRNVTRTKQDTPHMSARSITHSPTRDPARRTTCHVHPPRPSRVLTDARSGRLRLVHRTTDATRLKAQSTLYVWWWRPRQPTNWWAMASTTQPSTGDGDARCH